MLATLPAWYPVLCLFILGIIAGSFTNVLIVRIPNKETIHTRSHCTQCDTQIGWYDNIPLLSWIYLRGKCRHCHAPIPWRYPAVELVTGLLWAFLAATNYPHSLSPLAVGQYLLITLSVALAVIDIRTLRLPSPLVKWFTGISVATFVAILSVATWRTPSEWDTYLTSGGIAILCAVVYSGVYFTLWYISGGKWIGFGDVKLSPAIGLMLGLFGWEIALLGFALPYFIAFIPSIILMMKQKGLGTTRVPFGPYLLAGFWCAMIYGESILNWYYTIAHLN